MIENENPSPDYLKGFNYGYMIAEHIPDLAKQLSTVTGASDRFIGMKHGIEQFSKEKIQSITPDWLNEMDKSGPETKEPDKSIVEGKDDLEPEPGS